MDAFSEILFHAHSGLRYLILLAGVLSLGYSLVVTLRRQPWGKPGRILFSAFVGFMDLQILMGLILVFVRVFYPALWGHLTLMILAAAVAHVTLAMNKRRPPERRGYFATIGSAVSLLLIAAGIVSIGRSIL